MSKTVKCPKWGCDGVGIPVDTKKNSHSAKHLLATQQVVSSDLSVPLSVLLPELKAKMARQSLCVQSAVTFGKRKYNHKAELLLCLYFSFDEYIQVQ